jgi:hypothetical protein
MLKMLLSKANSAANEAERAKYMALYERASAASGDGGATPGKKRARASGSGGDGSGGAVGSGDAVAPVVPAHEDSKGGGKGGKGGKGSKGAKGGKGGKGSKFASGGGKGGKGGGYYNSSSGYRGGGKGYKGGGRGGGFKGGGKGRKGSDGGRGGGKGSKGKRSKPGHMTWRPVERSVLPIDEHRDEIVSTLQRHLVTIISGDTGCGKSTQVPQIIMDMDLGEDEEGEEAGGKAGGKAGEEGGAEGATAMDTETKAGEAADAAARAGGESAEDGGGLEDAEGSSPPAKRVKTEGDPGTGGGAATAKATAKKETEMMKTKIKKRRRPKVIVTQPRRLAAISLAQRVAKERLEVLGKSVGYRVARDSSTVDPETRCIFMTAGLLLQVNMHRVCV